MGGDTGYTGLVGTTHPHQPLTLGPPLPGDHLWTQICLLLGDAGAEGIAFAHPVGLQGPEARGRKGTSLSTSSPNLPNDANPNTTHHITLLSLLFLC